MLPEWLSLALELLSDSLVLKLLLSDLFGILSKVLSKVVVDFEFPLFSFFVKLSWSSCRGGVFGCLGRQVHRVSWTFELQALHEAMTQVRVGGLGLQETVDQDAVLKDTGALGHAVQKFLRLRGFDTV